MCKMALKRIIMVTVTVSLFFITLTACGGGSASGTVVDFADVTTVKFSGYDGAGYATLNMVSGNFIFMDGTGGKDENKPKWLSFVNSIKGELDKTKELSNGDTVTVTATYDEDLAKALNLSLKNVSKDFTVEGLDEIKDVTPDELVTVSFTGISPTGAVRVERTYSAYNVESYDDCVKNGDKISIKITADADALLKNGMRLTSDVYECEVEGLDEYVTPDTLDDDVIALLDKKVAEFAKDVKPVKRYLRIINDVNKDNSDRYGYNNIYYVLKVDGKYKLCWLGHPIKKADGTIYTEGTAQYTYTYSSSKDFKESLLSAKAEGNFTYTEF